jgi:soluble lytic murein transglycosylase
LQAEKLLAQGNIAAFMGISATLTDYPLYPYLQYQRLKDTLEQTEQVVAFLSDLKETRYADLLRTKWLGYLAKNGRWHDFIRYYVANENIALECQYALASYKTGNQLQGLVTAKSLWLRGNSLPEECDPLWVLFINSPEYTPELVWQRFELALGKDNVSVAEYLRRSMGKSDQDTADIWLRIHQNPTLIENGGFLSPNMGRLFAHGINRLAKSNISLANKLWHDRKQAFQIDGQIVQQLERSLALGLARSRLPGAYYQLSQLATVDAEVNEWKVRAALLEQNWQHVADALAGFTNQERQDPKWQYWQARTLDKTGNTAEAQVAYTKLAEDRSFYGFCSGHS